MPIIVRTARADELAHAEQLVVRSINDLTVRHGFGQIATSRPPDFQNFSLRDDPRGVWLAEDEGEIAGFALSWVCDHLWFLAELFVAPGRQGQGVGNELIGRTLQHASEAGATVNALITFAFNVVSQGLYVRHGMLPRVPIHMCTVDREALSRRTLGHSLRTTPITASEADLQALRRLDAAALGVSREKHHRYLLGDPAMQGVFFHDGSECVGYAYVHEAGHVGPLAAARTQAMPAVFTAALSVAVDRNAKQVSAFVPGVSEALTLAAGYGMRFALPMVLMSDRDFGDWRLYLPRNPGFM